MAATRVQAHEVAAVLQWHIRNDFISRGALLLGGMVAAAALVARGAARGGTAGQAQLAAGALVLAAGSLCIARYRPRLPCTAERALAGAWSPVPCMSKRHSRWQPQAPGRLCQGMLAQPALACRPRPAQAHLELAMWLASSCMSLQVAVRVCNPPASVSHGHAVTPDSA